MTSTDFSFVGFQGHPCKVCERNHRLDVLPVHGGWIAGVRCGCREPDGRPRRFSTDSSIFDSYEAAHAHKNAMTSGVFA